MIYDAVIMRTIVEMPEGLLADLGNLAKRERISRAEAIRRAVTDYLHKHPASDHGDEAFGIWSCRETSGTEYEDRVREDWNQGEGAP
jgi:metal-responsive CopG/Arc/MetJ family transcriptional regulator